VVAARERAVEEEEVVVVEKAMAIP